MRHAKYETDYRLTVRVHDFGVTAFVELLLNGERLTTFHPGTKDVSRAHDVALDYLTFAFLTAEDAVRDLAGIRPGNPDDYGK